MALTDKLTAIADAIREKTETTELLTLDEMPDAIAGISGAVGVVVHSGTESPVSSIGADGDIYLLVE